MVSDASVTFSRDRGGIVATMLRMRTMLSIVLAGVTACGFQSPGASGDGNSNSMPDAPQGNPADDDDDGDGVPNAADNCPQVANPDQFNEDGDARGDACDPCPQLAAPTDDADRDGDGIGDGCDPRPDQPGDKLVYWNGFHVPGNGLPAGLSQIHGSAQQWSVVNDQLVFTRNGDDWNIPAFDTGAKSHTTDASFEIITSYAVTPPSAAAAGVAVDVASNDDDVSECQARTDVQARELWYWNGRPGGTWNELKATAAMTPNDTYRAVLHRTTAALTCATTRNGTTASLDTQVKSANRTLAGLFVRNLDVRFNYLAIYTSP